MKIKYLILNLILILSSKLYLLGQDINSDFNKADLNKNSVNFINQEIKERESKIEELNKAVENLQVTIKTLTDPDIGQNNQIIVNKIKSEIDQKISEGDSIKKEISDLILKKSDLTSNQIQDISGSKDNLNLPISNFKKVEKPAQIKSVIFHPSTPQLSQPQAPVPQALIMQPQGPTMTTPALPSPINQPGIQQQAQQPVMQQPIMQQQVVQPIAQPEPIPQPIQQQSVQQPVEQQQIVQPSIQPLSPTYDPRSFIRHRPFRGHRRYRQYRRFDEFDNSQDRYQDRQTYESAANVQDDTQAKSQQNATDKSIASNANALTGASVTNQAVSGQQATDKSTGGQQTTGQLVIDKSATDQSVTDKSVTDKSVAGKYDNKTYRAGRKLQN